MSSGRKHKDKGAADGQPPSGQASGSDEATGSAVTPTWPHQIRLLLDSRRLRDQPSSTAAVAAVWQKAVECAHDAELPKLSIDGGLRLAYDAGHLAALALLAAHGLRTGSGPGHHDLAFYGAAAFGHLGLEHLVPDSEEVRSLRKGSMYDPVIAGRREQKAALAWMQRTLPAIRDALLVARPQLSGVLTQYR